MILQLQQIARIALKAYHVDFMAACYLQYFLARWSYDPLQMENPYSVNKRPVSHNKLVKL